LRKAAVKLAQQPTRVRAVEGSLEEFGVLLESNRETALKEAAYAKGLFDAGQFSAKALDQATAALEEMRAEMSERLAETAALLSVEVLQELLRVELVAKNYDITAIVRTTIAEAGHAPGAMALHVHPDDAIQLESVPFRTGTTIEADPTVRRGDVQLHTSGGLLVRDMDACAAAIRERILAEVSSC
jgi:flagellar biosynthesis/type III secretory pathway protein FliH